MTREAAWNSALALLDETLVLAEQLRNDHLLRREVGSRQRAEGERGHEQAAEAQRAAPVQYRNEGHDGRPQTVAEDHRATGAEPAEELAAR